MQEAANKQKRITLKTMGHLHNHVWTSTHWQEILHLQTGQDFRLIHAVMQVTRFTEEKVYVLNALLSLYWNYYAKWPPNFAWAFAILQTGFRTSRELLQFCKPIPELRASLCNFANQFPNFARAFAILQTNSRTSRESLQFCKPIPELRASPCNFANRFPNFAHGFTLLGGIGKLQTDEFGMAWGQKL